MPATSPPTTPDAPASAPDTPPSPSTVADRTVDPTRRLPSGRAVLGGVLVAAAAAGIFAATRPVASTPSTHYVVARHAITPGHQITRADLTTVAVDLPPSLAERAIGQPEDAVGQIALGRIPSGSLVDPESLAGGTRAAATSLISFAIAPDRAAAGDLVAGDRIDLFVTWNDDAATERVGHGLRVAAVDRPDHDALGGDADLVVSIGVGHDVDLVELTQAIRTGELTVVRTTGAAPAT